MKEKKYYKNLMILAFSLILMNSSALALQNAKTMLMPYGPVLSPKGDEIVFDFIWERNKKTGSDIGILSLESDATKIITKSELDGSLNESPTWSKDGKHVIYRSTRKNGMGLFSFNLETLEEKTIAFLLDSENKDCKKDCKEFSYSYPVGLPLINKIAFIKQTFDEGTIKYSGYLYDFNDKTEKEIARDVSPTTAFRHAWSISYDGNYVIYTKKADGYDDIWSSNILKDHISGQRLTRGYNVLYLRPSPRKNEILFVAKEEKKRSWSLYKLNLDTRKEEKLFEGNIYNLGFPSWSQNGDQIIFVNDNNIIKIIDTNNIGIIAELKIDMETITFPLLVKNRKVIFYHKNSSIWSIDVENKILKKVFPKDR